MAKEKEEEEKRKEATKDSEAKPAEKENGEPEGNEEFLVENSKKYSYWIEKKGFGINYTLKKILNLCITIPLFIYK